MGGTLYAQPRASTPLVDVKTTYVDGAPFLYWKSYPALSCPPMDWADRNPGTSSHAIMVLGCTVLTVPSYPS